MSARQQGKQRISPNLDSHEPDIAHAKRASNVPSRCAPAWVKTTNGVDNFKTPSTIKWLTHLFQPSWVFHRDFLGHSEFSFCVQHISFFPQHVPDWRNIKMMRGRQIIGEGTTQQPHKMNLICEWRERISRCSASDRYRVWLVYLHHVP